MYLSTRQKPVFVTADRIDEWAEAGGARMNASIEKHRLGQSRQLLCDGQ